MPRKAGADSPPSMPADRPARHPHAPTARGRQRTAARLTALAALWSGARPEPGALAAGSPQATAGRDAAAGRTAPDQPTAQRPAATTTARPMLSRRARRACPRAASACVDLDDRLTWLQSDTAISYGPVRMEPGA